jgi:hypothetical protein
MKVHFRNGDIQQYPDDAWNAFIGVLARSPHELDIEQVPAHLVFVYESEVQNGGHLQYFENGYGGAAAVTVEALRLLHAHRHAAILEEAYALHLQENRPKSEAKEEYIAAALEDRYGQLDALFGDCEPALIAFLEQHLAERPEPYFDLSE